MTNNATLNWLWATQYSFRVESPVNGAVAGTSNDWYDAGTAIDLHATPEEHYAFSEWQNVPGGTSTNNPLSFTLTAACTNVTAVFELKQYSLTVVSAYGTPLPGSTNVTAFEFSRQVIEPQYIELEPGTRVRLSGHTVQGGEVHTSPP